MTGSYKVRATHLECVYEDHNKYYRTYIVEGGDGVVFLLRNWGKRGAPTGQWMRDPATGQRAEKRRNSLYNEKTGKGYWEIHQTTFTISDTIAEELAYAHHKDLPESETEHIGQAFDTQWYADVVCDRSEEPDTGDEMLVWVPNWTTGQHDRKPARRVAADLKPSVVYIDSQRDIAVLKTTNANCETLGAVFDETHTAPARSEDDVNLVVVANRLWNPKSSGPYRILYNAVRDARRIFRKPATSVMEEN